MSLSISLESFSDRAFVDEWNTLATASQAGVFATPDWHESVQAAYGRRGRSVLCSLRDAGRLVGVAPLRLGRSWLVLRSASLLGMGEGGYGLADYAGLVAAPDREVEVADALLSWIRKLSRWDVVDLQQLPDGVLATALVRAIHSAGLPALVQKQNACHLIDLPSTWPEYRSRLSPGTRDWLERKPRKAERELGATIELVERDRILDEYVNMRRFQAERFGRQPVEAERKLGIVISAWLTRAHERGWLRMFRLKSGDRTLGVLLGYEYQGTFFFHSAAFDSAFSAARYSLGASLLAASLRWSIEHRLDRFDMLRGHYEYKERLGSRLHFNYRLMVFRRSIAGIGLERAMRLRASMKGGREWQALGRADEAPAGPETASESAADPAHQVARAPVGVE